MSRIQIIALAVSILSALVLFQLIRKKKLKEQYSLLWFLTDMVIFVFAVWESLLTRISEALGIQVPSNALFLLALMFLFAIVLHFSLIASRLTDQSKMLAQKLALMDHELRRERGKADPPARPDAIDDSV